MSLSNKLTLDKVDVNGKRVIMRWVSPAAVVSGRTNVTSGVFNFSANRFQFVDEDLKIWWVSACWSFRSGEERTGSEVVTFPSVLRACEEMLHG